MRNLVVVPVVAAAVVSLLPGASVHREVPAHRSLVPLDVPQSDARVPVNTRPGALVMFLNTTWLIRRDVVLLSAEPVGLPPGVADVGTRVGFLRCDDCAAPPGLVSMPQPVLYTCTDRFPPDGYGPTYDVRGLELPAWAPAVFFTYVRGTALGRYTVDGLRVRYRVPGARGEHTAEIRAAGLALLVAEPERVDSFEVYSTCSRPRPGWWEPGGPPGSMPVR